MCVLGSYAGILPERYNKTVEAVSHSPTSMKRYPKDILGQTLLIKTNQHVHGYDLCVCHRQSQLYRCRVGLGACSALCNGSFGDRNW
jgi:hypothetical protein